MIGSPSPNDDLVIGVDGGATKTIAWVAPVDDPANRMILGIGHAGPSNPRSVGFEPAQLAIQEAIHNALDRANRSHAPVGAAWLGIAGAGRESEQHQLEAWSKQDGQIAQQVRVSGDAEPILAAASTENWGIALIGGTGSLAWGRNQHGDVARAGGWGYLIGDEGSAYAIAIAAIRSAVQSADGRRPTTPLLENMLLYFDATSPENLIEIIHSREMARDRIAGSARIVFTLTDDLTATEIVAEAVNDLANLVATLARRLDVSSSGYPLALTGSLLLNQEAFRLAIIDQLRDNSCGPSTVTLVTDAVQGAVALARRLVSPDAVPRHS